jgi:hypothetical protein
MEVSFVFSDFTDTTTTYTRELCRRRRSKTLFTLFHIGKSSSNAFPNVSTSSSPTLSLSQFFRQFMQVSCLKEYRFLLTVFLKMNETIPLFSFYFKLIRFLGFYSQSDGICNSLSIFFSVSD